MGVELPKKWSEQNLTDLTSDYSPAIIKLLKVTKEYQQVGWDEQLLRAELLLLMSNINSPSTYHHPGLG